jgi:hypothetical protein
MRCAPSVSFVPSVAPLCAEAIGSASVPKSRSGISHVLVFALLVRCSCAARALLVRCSCAARALLVRGSCAALKAGQASAMYLSLRCSYAARALLVRCSCEARARFHLAWPIWRVLPAAELPYKDSGWNPQDRRREVEPRASQGARGSARLAIGSASVPKGRSGISHVLVFALLVRCSCAARALLVRSSCEVPPRMAYLAGSTRRRAAI